jgi:hypothetical protein
MLIFYFRLADAYLMYAECAVRGAGGSLVTATKYVNDLRTELKGAAVQGDLNLNFILDERGRELHWEGHRRTDLIRFGKRKLFMALEEMYLEDLNSYRDLFPIPATAHQIVN